MPDQIDMRSALAVILAAIVAGVAALPPTAEAGAEQADQRLEQALSELVAIPDGPPGVSAVIQRGRHAKLHRAGLAEVGTSRPIRLKQRMRIASVTKAFTGAVALRLVERGKLSLGDTIGELRPELPAEWHPITLRQLLYHTSGLPNYTATPAFQAYLPDHLSDYISRELIIAFAATEPLEFPPGSRYEYSNTDNIVIGLMAESATGRSYRRLLRRLVLDPFDLRETSLPVTTLTLPDPFVHGYASEGPDQPPSDVSELISPSGVWAAGAIVSSPRDLNTFARAWAGGDLLRSKKLRRAQTDFLPPVSAGDPPGPGQNRGGLTLYRYRTSCGVVLGHSGNFPGYTQWIAASPNGERSAVVSANLQLAPPSTGDQDAFRQLRQVFHRAACAALAG